MSPRETGGRSRSPSVRSQRSNRRTNRRESNNSSPRPSTAGKVRPSLLFCMRNWTQQQGCRMRLQELDWEAAATCGGETGLWARQHGARARAALALPLTFPRDPGQLLAVPGFGADQLCMAAEVGAQEPRGSLGSYSHLWRRGRAEDARCKTNTC